MLPARRLRHRAAFAAIALAFGLSAPVASAQDASYRTQALPTPAPLAGGAAKKASASASRSRVTLKAKRRFSLAALRWDGKGDVSGRLRAKQADGSWTPWSTLESERAGLDGVAEAGGAAAAAVRKRGARAARQGSTEPIWTGPSRTLQVEFNGRVPKGVRAAFVDVSGKPVAAAARKARQSDGYAGIQPRAAWDPNNECAPRATSALGTVEGVVVHHTAGSNTYTQAQVPALLLAICKYHRNANGWNDVGYNVLVDKYGGAWEGRAGGLASAVIGAHAQGFNSNTAGVSILGDYTSIAPPPEALSTVARVSAWKLAVAGKPRSGDVTLTSAGGSLSRFGGGKTATLPRVMGHRDVGQTACPGNMGYPALDGVRAAVAAGSVTLPTGLPSSPAQVNPVKISISTARKVRAGTTSVVRGTVKQGTSPLKSAELALQVRTGEDSWLTVERAESDSKGKYEFKHRFSRTWAMRVIRTDGAGTSSAFVNVVMVAKLALKTPKRLTVGKKIQLRGTIAPGRGPVTLQIERRSPSGRWVKSPEQKVTQKGRSLRVNITPHSPTQYRFRLAYAGSSLTAAARSPARYVTAYRPGTTAGGTSLSD